MSHTDFVYPQIPSRDFTYLQVSPGQVREEKDEYSDGLTSLLELTDLINDRLTKAEALAWVLFGSKHTPEQNVQVTALVIAELIHEALEAHEKQWDKIRQNAS